jgi:TonB family protein
MRFLALAALFEAARLQEGAPPGRLPQQAGGGEVLLELSLDAEGKPSGTKTLRDTPPFTRLLAQQVAGWRFAPARVEGSAAPSRVLVVGVFRPATLVGPAPGQPAQDAESASAEVPFPLEMEGPAYPAQGLGDATVLLEAEVGQDGRVAGTRVVAGGSPFDSAAAEAARGWRFRPARHEGEPVPALAYLVFGFRTPVAPPPKPR